MSESAQIETITTPPAPIPAPEPVKAAPVAVPSTAKAVIRKLLSGKLKRAEFERTVYRIKPDEGVTLEDVLKPEFWAHVGEKLRPFDILEILFHDGTRYTELIVVDAGKLWAKVAIKSDVNLAGSAAAAQAVREEKEFNGDFEVKHKGPSVKWCVIRKSDGERIQEGMGTRQEAQIWLDNYQKALAA